jgi:hypothetical protein
MEDGLCIVLGPIYTHMDRVIQEKFWPLLNKLLARSGRDDMVSSQFQHLVICFLGYIKCTDRIIFTARYWKKVSFLIIVLIIHE